METTLPRETSTHEPSVTLRIEHPDDFSIALVIDDIDPRIAALLGQEQKDLIGKPLEALGGKDAATYAEWAELILQSCLMPLYGGDNLPGAAGQNYILQYFKATEDWRIVTITIDRARGLAHVSFETLAGFGEQKILRQLMQLRRFEEMSSGVSANLRWTIDCRGQKIFLSTGLSHLLGLGDRACVLPLRRYFDGVHPADRQSLIEELDSIRSSLVTRSRHLREDGETLHLRSYATPLHDEEGRLTRIHGLSEDITGTVRGEDDLRLSEARFRQLAELSGDLFLTATPDLRYSYVAPRTATLLGFEAEDLLGKPIGVVLEGRVNYEAAFREIMEILRKRSSGNVECRVRVASGQLRWYRITVFTVKEEDGRTAEFVAIGKDITEQKHSDEKFKFLRTHDDLTGVFNRGYIWSLLEELMAEGREDFCLVLVDINGLKAVNDVFGQEKGDQVIVDVAGAVRRAFKRRRHIARIGGDEFAVVVIGSDTADVEASCEELARFEEASHRRMLPISLACGTACPIQPGDTVQSLFERAERHMMNRKLLQRQSQHSQVVNSLTEALGVRNLETAEHLERMTLMVAGLGRRLGLAPGEFDQLLLLAKLHDVGKLGIPDHIIAKPGPLDEAEWAVMRTHSDVGARIVAEAPELSAIGIGIRHHHERWDGAGYPDGLAGDAIPLQSQIITVVDAYDVMTHRRSYKEPIPHEAAVAELQRCRGTQFAPAVVDRFLDILDELPPEVLAQPDDDNQ